MRMPSFLVISTFTCLMSAVPAPLLMAQEAPDAVVLHVGDAAPALGVSEWLRGEPVETFEAGTVYVIECWATWCGPCLRSIPHLAELQAAHPEDVVVIGVDVWERDAGAAAAFLENDSRADAMTYRVAVDGNGQFASSWLRPLGIDSIPAVMIVNQLGELAWRGHPQDMAPFVAAVVAGEDLAPLQEALALFEATRTQSYQMMAAEQHADALALINGFLETYPQFAQRSFSMQLSLLLATGDEAACLTAIQDAGEAGWLEDDLLMQSAVRSLLSMISFAPVAGVTEDSEEAARLALAQSLALEFASEYAESKATWYAYALLAETHVALGDIAGAIEAQQRAIEVIQEDPTVKPRTREGRLPMLQQQLEEYQAALASETEEALED